MCDIEFTKTYILTNFNLNTIIVENFCSEQTRIKSLLRRLKNICMASEIL